MTKPTALLLLLTISAALAQTGPSMDPVEKQEPSPMAGFAGLGKDRPADAKTEITATKEATFDNAANVAEFDGRVVVRDPQFTLTCDHLKVTLSKTRKGMEVAEAIGNVVIIQENTDKKTGKANNAIGRAETATYHPASGKVTLKGWPSVQQGMNNQVATEQSTVMVLNRNGASHTDGPSKTVIVETKEAGAAQ
ncbi:MAG: LptA/OstA family protein [Verrucomicrobiae bacterium]